MTQKEIRKKIESNKTCLSGNGKDGERLHLQYVELKNLDMVGADLRYAIISNSIIISCRFNKADLQYIDLNSSIISSSKFNETNMDYSIMNNSSIGGCDLSYAFMRYSELKNVTFNNVNAFCLDMSNADLTGSILKKVHLHDATLNEADLTNVVLDNCSFYRTDFYNTKSYRSFEDYDNYGDVREVHAIQHGEKWMVQAGSFWGPLSEYEKMRKEVKE